MRKWKVTSVRVASARKPSTPSQVPRASWSAIGPDSTAPTTQPSTGSWMARISTSASSTLRLVAYGRV